MSFKLTVEVPLFFAFLGFLLTDSVNTNLMIFRTCYVTLGFDKHNCSLLGNTDNEITRKLEKLVQPKADIIGMVKTSVDSGFGALLCIFVGAWSDRFGRKPVIVLNLIGYFVMLLVMVAFSALENLSPWFMMMCSIPVILTGGSNAFLTVLLAYMTDITTEERRGIRMGIFELFMALGVLIGSYSSSYLLNATNYVTVYAIAAIFLLCGLLHTVFCIPESLEVRETENKFTSFFQVQNISGIFKTTFRNRPNYNRAIILLLMFALALYFVVVAGDGSVMFLFMREKFFWTLRQYTFYSGVCNIFWVTGAIIVVYFLHHKFKISEANLVFVGFVSLMLGSLIQGIANVDWWIYLAAVVKLPSSGNSPMTRSLMSKLVNVDESAKIFAVFNIISSILGLIGAPVFTTLYNATLDTVPGAFNYVTASAHAVTSTCVFVVLMLQCRTVTEDYARMENEDNVEREGNIQNIVNECENTHEESVRS